MNAKSPNSLKISGQTTLEDQLLPISFAPEVVYMPTTAGNRGGLFNTDGSPISAAINHRGKEAHLSASIDKTIDISALPTLENDRECFFIGEINPHYGHFLLESTNRLWPLLHWRRGFSGNLLYLGSPDVVAKKTYIRQVFETLALDGKDFTAYPAPCKIRNVFIPAPAFEIRLRAHHLFSETLRHSGRCLAGDLETINNSNLTPLYLSKSKLSSGVSCITNETAIEDALRKAGVDILHPETLSLPEQIRALASRKYLLGSVGSALHTLLFCPGGKSISGVSLGDKINANYIMIDRLCGNTGHYQASTDMTITMTNNATTGAPRFMRTFHAHQPDYVAAQLLAAFDEPIFSDQHADYAKF